MPRFFISATNSVYKSRDQGSEYSRPEDALVSGIRAAAALALDEVDQGKLVAAIEIRIEEADGTALLRSVLSIGVSPLLPASD